MLKLYGFAVSNYYNMVKLALLEKGLPFEEVPFYAGQSAEALAISPRGKVPVLETDKGFLNNVTSTRQNVTVKFDEIFYLRPGKITVTEVK